MNDSFMFYLRSFEHLKWSNSKMFYSHFFMHIKISFASKNVLYFTFPRIQPVQPTKSC